MAATVYCQPIEMRVGKVLGFDMQQANRWQWRPDYEGLELGQMRCVARAPSTCRSCSDYTVPQVAKIGSVNRRQQWTALGPVTEAFAFDFYDGQANMQPAKAALPLTMLAPGTCNAIAFWFSLHLDEETELCTSPYENKVPLHGAAACNNLVGRRHHPADGLCRG